LVGLLAKVSRLKNSREIRGGGRPRPTKAGNECCRGRHANLAPDGRYQLRSPSHFKGRAPRRFWHISDSEATRKTVAKMSLRHRSKISRLKARRSSNHVGTTSCSDELTGDFRHCNSRKVFCNKERSCPQLICTDDEWLIGRKFIGNQSRWSVPNQNKVLQMPVQTLRLDG
jgi:hypothetical protein